MKGVTVCTGFIRIFSNSRSEISGVPIVLINNRPHDRDARKTSRLEMRKIDEELREFEVVQCCLS